MKKKLDVSDIMSHAWFYVATFSSHFSGLEWVEDAGIKKLAFFIPFKPQNGNTGPIVHYFSGFRVRVSDHVPDL